MSNPNPKINPDAQFKTGNPGGPGRPALDPVAGTKILNVRVPVPLAEWIAARAKAGGTNVSEYVRDVLLKHQEETEKQKP